VETKSEASVGTSVRYRCEACGNLTRFDVTTTRRTREFFHFSVGGDCTVEETAVLDETVEGVTCRWCDREDSVVKIEGSSATVSSGS